MERWENLNKLLCLRNNTHGHNQDNFVTYL